MATSISSLFARKPREAQPKRADYAQPMINQEMTSREWAILLFLAVIWGGAFLFIGVGVRPRLPRLAFKQAGDARRHSAQLESEVLGCQQKAAGGQ